MPPRLSAAHRGDMVRTVGPFQVRRRDGRIIFVEGVTHQVEFDGKHVRIAQVTDISERLQTERSLAQYRATEQRVTDAAELPGQPASSRGGPRAAAHRGRVARRRPPRRKPPMRPRAPSWPTPATKSARP